MSDVIVVNDKDEIVGTMSREEAHRTGTPHRIAVVYVANQKGEILIQIRKGGRLDHSSAGHVDVGETYEDAARRELQEELGITNTDLVSFGVISSYESPPAFIENRTHVMGMFYCEAEPGELQEEEIEGVFWADPREVFAEMEANPESTKWSGGFRASLRQYLIHRN
ncbi:MAG: NUDIX domain-containing protein [Candidatus Pacebacteria bacterium]|nr:NUDIX domain-containing protein [Candidatus Paceibacterota bacterium]